MYTIYILPYHESYLEGVSLNIFRITAKYKNPVIQYRSMHAGIFNLTGLTAKTLFVFLIVLLFSSCQTPLPEFSHKEKTYDRSQIDCIDVRGTVLGDIIPNTSVFLYNTSTTAYDVVMTEIKEPFPATSSFVNESKGFSFGCLLPGKYAFVIPTISFNGSIGSPLPYEFDCQNLSLRIAFQGGNYSYAVCAFSIKNSHQLKTDCIENEKNCEEPGNLYRSCSK